MEKISLDQIREILKKHKHTPHGLRLYKWMTKKRVEDFKLWHVYASRFQPFSGFDKNIDVHDFTAQDIYIGRADLENRSLPSAASFNHVLSKSSPTTYAIGYTTGDYRDFWVDITDWFFNELRTKQICEVVPYRHSCLPDVTFQKGITTRTCEYCGYTEKKLIKQETVTVEYWVPVENEEKK